MNPNAQDNRWNFRNDPVSWYNSIDSLLYMFNIRHIRKTFDTFNTFRMHARRVELWNSIFCLDRREDGFPNVKRNSPI